MTHQVMIVCGYVRSTDLVVDKGGAVVQCDMVVEQLDVAWLQDIVDGQLITGGQGLKQGNGLQLVLWCGAGGGAVSSCVSRHTDLYVSVAM